jgi:hypothetical protein
MIRTYKKLFCKRYKRKFGEIRRNSEKSGEIKRNPEESGEIRRNSTKFGEIRRNPEESGEIQRNPEESGGIRRNPEKSETLIWSNPENLKKSSNFLHNFFLKLFFENQKAILNRLAKNIIKVFLELSSCAEIFSTIF